MQQIPIHHNYTPFERRPPSLTLLSSLCFCGASATSTFLFSDTETLLIQRVCPPYTISSSLAFSGPSCTRCRMGSLWARGAVCERGERERELEGERERGGEVGVSSVAEITAMSLGVCTTHIAGPGGRARNGKYKVQGKCWGRGRVRNTYSSQREPCVGLQDVTNQTIYV